MSERYGKTYGPYKRDERTQEIIHGKWSHPVFEYLQDTKWIFTEKLDGTNMRLIYTPQMYTLHSDGSSSKSTPPSLTLKGRSDNAFVHGTLQEWAQSLDVARFAKVLGGNEVCIYGEGIGAGIQRGGENYGDPHFRAFAMYGFDEWGWWDHHIAMEACRQLNIKVAPTILEGTLLDGIAFMEQGFRTGITGVEKGWAEGLVGVPTIPLYSPNLGGRLCVKIKDCDFNVRD